MTELQPKKTYTPDERAIHAGTFGSATLCVLFAACVTTPAVGDDWPQWRGPGRDGVWHETGIIEEFAGPRLALRWRAVISSGYSGPTVADGRVYVADFQNHRIQVFSPEGRSLTAFGSQGTDPDQFDRPTDLDFGPDGRIYVVDFGNDRVQVFAPLVGVEP